MCTISEVSELLFQWIGNDYFEEDCGMRIVQCIRPAVESAGADLGGGYWQYLLL